MTSFAKRGEREIYKGYVISVASGTFVGPDGEEFERDIVHHPGAVSIVPAHEDGTVTLVRQYRAPLDAELLEVPAGKRDVAGEDVAITAARELAEEVGLVAGRLELLVEFYNSPGFSDEHSFVFLARDLTACAMERDGVEEMAMQIERVALADAPSLIAAGEIKDAKTIIGLLLARERLGMS
ncbi:MAG: ADP-ribose pyrophosphatase [Acidimicrobiaceae bacterium]